MLKIAVCDHELIFANEIKILLENYFKDFKIEINCSTFSDEKELMSRFGEFDYDVIFLDIELKNSNGINIAKEIRSLNFKGVLVLFCRTLMKKNMDLLILDEPNSGLDVLSEKNIYDILNEQLDGVTKILVTHRLHLIDLRGYRVIYIEDGSICEDEKSEILFIRNTKFKKFCKKNKNRRF